MTGNTEPPLNAMLLGPEVRVRDAVARVEEELGRASCPPGLRSAWDGLVAALDLRPPPELRICPSCGHSGMRAATRCGHCWVALTPLVEAPTQARAP